MMQGHCAALSSIYDNYCILKCRNMTSIIIKEPNKNATIQYKSYDSESRVFFS